MAKIYLALLAFCLFPAFGWAQESVSGTITSTDEPAGLPGAAVSIEGSKRGIASSVDGTYTILLEPSDSVLLVSFVGYATQRISIAGRSKIDVVLSPEMQTTEEVVVIGYGTQRKSDITGSISSVKGDDLIKVPNNNPIQALQGKATGVQVVSNSGSPGQAPKVRIRGVGSFGADNKNGPLYVVDGVFMRDITNINSQDIVSIEVLKDASSAAIFGVEGANGVILVTTKQGKDGKTNFSVQAEYGLQNVNKRIGVLTGREFGAVINEISPGTYNNLDALPNTDWQDLVLRKNVAVQNYQFSASGGSKNSTFYLGLGYFRQDGIVPNSWFERFSIRTNASYNVTDWLKIGTNLTVAPSYQRVVSGNVIANSYRAQPLIAPYRPDGDPIKYSTVPDYGNPLADLEYNSNNYNRVLNGIGNAYAEATLPIGFKYRFNTGIDLNTISGTNFVPKYFVSTAQQNPNSFLVSTRDYRANSLIDNLLYYNRTFSKLSVDALAGLSFYRNYNNNLNITTYNLLRDTPNLWYPNAGQSLAAGVKGGADLILKTSYFARTNFTWDNKYILTGTYRVDASSVFDKDNRSAAFPSIAAGWVLSEEPFLRDVKVINNLKLRASYGKLGNQAVNSSRDRYSLINQNAPSVFGQTGTLLQGATLASTNNPGLKWETTTQTDIGLELGLLNNRLSVEFDYYNRATRDILVQLSTPGYYGNGDGTRITYNAAAVDNKGLEFNINWRDKVGKVGYRIGALATTFNNKVKSLGATLANDSYISSGNVANQSVTRTEVGKSVGAFYGYQVLGIFQTEDELNNYPHLDGTKVGDLKYANTNGDGNLNEADRTYIGSPIPDFVYGFSAGVNFAGFDLSADFQGQVGNEIFNGKKAQRFGNPNYEADFRDRFIAPSNNSSGQISNTIPRASVSDNNFRSSTYLIEDGGYLRLRTLTLSYALPAALATKVHMAGASVYLRGTNLFTFTKFTGYSPEVGGADDLSTGIDNGIYPVTSVYSLGTNITF